MTELQQRLLTMLSWFHEFCVNHNLRYYALGGTLLGAVRHKGFIPWDDDIDVGMPREDYEHLRVEMQNEDTDSKYIIETPQSKAKDFVYAYSKIYDVSTTLIEKGKRDIKRGIYLDVFPLDGLGYSEIEAKKNFKRTAKLVKKLAIRVSPIRKGRGFAKNCTVILARCIPNFLMNEKKLAEKLDKTASQISFEMSAYVGNLVCNYKLNNILKRSYFGKPTLYKFEDIEIYGPEDYEGYLCKVFGDWRKLPPIEEQVSFHLKTNMDLHKSFLN